ncbi:MAG: membrane protein insertase YidC [Ignavibacteriae bacterium]|nr:membrane protein insertase YidC [Ignavibacteriota bacterium]
MDRQQILGFGLIFLLLIVWMVLNTPPAPPPLTQQQIDSLAQVQATKDSIAALRAAPTQEVAATPSRERPTPVDQNGKFFAGREHGADKLITIETDLYRATISSKGGLIHTWELKQFNTWDGQPVQLVSDSTGDFSLLFVTTDGKRINTRDLYFDLPSTTTHIEISGEQEYRLDAVLPAGNGGNLVKTFVFKNGTYGLDVAYRFNRLAEVIAFEYQAIWESGLRYAEESSQDEASFGAGYALAGGELTEIDATDAATKEQKDLAGVIDWVAARNKYFAVAIIPEAGKSEGAYIEGTRRNLPNEEVKESYNLSVKMPFRAGETEAANFKVYLGPLDIDLLRDYDNGLEKVMSLGWAWIIRPIAEYVMLPLMQLIHYAIPNWGLVIIVFTFIIKIALHPLTKSSMKSMKKMQALQPMMNELREKHKDDPQKMNAAIMNLYKEYGVNPAGGCLPLLLQFPILIALFNVFRGAIELRQSEFFWWINDLSVPDYIVELPFSIPFFGITELSGLALLMGVTMFIQQKQSIKDPRQKAMVYVMPVMFTLLFNSFPSGLNLYYFVFNVLSIAQQMYINKQHGDAPPQKVDQKKKRGGIFGKLQMPKLPQQK